MVRMNDEQWEKFRQMGGGDWLRMFLDAKPANYHQVFKPAEKIIRRTKRKKPGESNETHVRDT